MSRARLLGVGLAVVAIVSTTPPQPARPEIAVAMPSGLPGEGMAAAPASKPAYVHPRASVQRWRRTAMSAGWAPEQWRRLSCVIWRESGGQPSVHNGRDPHGGSLGLAQINAVHVKWLRTKGVLRRFTDLRNPYINLRAAKVLHAAEGWAPWRSTRRPC